MSRTTELYACLYARELPTQSLQRLQPARQQKACVVLTGTAPNESVCSLNGRAKRMQITHGMTRIEVEGYPELDILKRSLETEATVRAILHKCAGAFSPRVQDESTDIDFLCVLDIAGTLSIFGSPALLAQHLFEQTRSAGIHARVAVSGNFHTAVCVAKGMPAAATTRVVAAGQEAAALAALPLSVLPLRIPEAEIFTLWGVHTLGMLASLPETELVSRLGQAGRHLQQMARGVLPHTFQPTERLPNLEETLQFDTAVDLLESLLFGINLMLQQLLAQAIARILALASVTLTLTLDGGSTHTQTVRPALPTNDKALWLKLVQLQLEAHPPSAPVQAIQLSADPGITSKAQLGLFAPQLPESSRLDVAVARIRALVGEDNVGRAVLEDSHAHDSCRIEPFQIAPGTAAAAAAAPRQVRSCTRQLRPPEPISVGLHDTTPSAFLFRGQQYTVERAFGPWLLSGDWWARTAWSIVQWDLIATTRTGSQLCCCITQDRVRNIWQMVSLYD